MIFHDFRIPFQVVAASRPRVKRNGGVFYTKKYSEFKRSVAMWIRPKKFKMIPQYTSIYVGCTFAIPLSKKIRRGKDAEYLHMHPCTAVGDVDNMCKAVLDSLQGEVFYDDRYVYKIYCSKVWINNDKGYIDVQIGSDED